MPKLDIEAALKEHNKLSIEDALKPQEDHGMLSNLALGALKGATDIGTTLLRPVDAAMDYFSPQQQNLSSLVTGKKPLSRHEQRVAALQQFYGENANPDSLAFKSGALTSQIAGTAGAGGVLAKGATAVGGALPSVAPYAAKVAQALETGGFRLGGVPATTTAGKVANALTRVGAGAATGAAQTAMVSPENTAEGALIGGAMPVAVKAAGALGKLAGVGQVSPEVAALYNKAKAMGVEIPADRIANSRPLNAMAASLDYVPFSGRIKAEDKMLSGLSRAAARTMGQDTDNLAAALSNARSNLGAKFEHYLSSNSVKVDNQFLNELGDIGQKAARELSPSDARIVTNQIDDIINASKNGVIDGQRAYNIKKTLDAIGKRNSNEAFYAKQARNSLLDALNRSMSPDDAAAFAKVRQQYGNMRTLEKLAPNGAEGQVSPGRLGNLRNINNKDLKDVADVAAQFVKTRENPHGAAQRIAMALLGSAGLGGGAATGTLPFIAGGMAAGRAANTALNSNMVRNALTGNSQVSPELINLLRTTPLITSVGQ